MLPKLTRTVVNMHGVECATEYTFASDRTVELFSIVPAPWDDGKSENVIDCLTPAQLDDITNRILEAHDYEADQGHWPTHSDA